MATVKDKLQALRDEADTLVKLIDADKPGLMSWSWMLFGDRLNSLHALIHEAKESA